MSVGPREAALHLLTAGLETRGESLLLEEEQHEPYRITADPSHVLLVSGVAHQVPYHVTA